MTTTELFNDIARMGKGKQGMSDGEVVMAVAVIHFDWFAAHPQEVDAASIIAAWRGECPECLGEGFIDTGEGDKPCDCPAGEAWQAEQEAAMMEDIRGDIEATIALREWELTPDNDTGWPNTTPAGGWTFDNPPY